MADPEVYWSMTPHEVNLLLRGFRRRLFMLQTVTEYGAALSAVGSSGITPPFTDPDAEGAA